MKGDNYWMLNFINCNREPKITIETAKELYIPRERLLLEKQYGIESVNQLFGEPSHLEKAEMLLLKVEEEKISETEKYECLIKLVHEILNVVETQAYWDDNSVLQKYLVLYTGIPIQVYDCKYPLYFISPKLKMKDVTVDELKVAKNLWEMKEANPAMRKYIEYIFELVYISLKEIFKEVKMKIMGK